jgi:hypothetical protein
MADRIITNVYLDIELKKMARKDALDKGITFRDWLEDAIRMKLESKQESTEHTKVI